ncbi:acyl-CoA thioesterase [Arthrobacter sp. PvP102]|uniref:hotdog fold thioesterase n=1 Tax=unclassified Arthrobacter TaxID=235627 RepID=UPI001AE9D043|nr:MULTISPECIES: hotdog fold thioesterase [unclassified Arthrobacter]MBP1232576.1 acyl-CoA thioesterase [Arthrobacter sp. PvP103]MBP1237711.1 acyl-CoA thioesterase [Arthrobacter sp. PvP102]
MAEATLSGATHPILENDYASEWMGIEVLKVDDGHASIRMTLRQEMLNGFGMAHGGMIFAFGDTAFALACNPADPQAGADTITVASGVDINFLKPAFTGQVITAVANRRAHAGRSGLYDVQIFAADPHPAAGDYTGGHTASSPAEPPAGAGPEETPGELIAEFRGRCRTISKK